MRDLDPIFEQSDFAGRAVSGEISAWGSRAQLFLSLSAITISAALCVPAVNAGTHRAVINLKISYRKQELINVLD